MNIRKRISRRTLATVGLGSGAAMLGFGLRSVLAEGIPANSPLYYAGTLAESGALVSGTRAITINLWPSATATGTPLCQTVESNTQVTSGRFRVALAGLCKAAINANSSAWVEVVDGATSLGRVPVGAVPYAVEADHAVNASNATYAAVAAYAADAGHAAFADTATTAVSLVADAGGGLAIYTVPGNNLQPPCVVNAGTNIVDCTCPAGTFVVAAGGDTGQGSGHVMRESRAISASTWRLTCVNGTTDAPCATYTLVCSRLGP